MTEGQAGEDKEDCTDDEEDKEEGELGEDPRAGRRSNPRTGRRWNPRARRRSNPKNRSSLEPKNRSSLEPQEPVAGVHGLCTAMAAAAVRRLATASGARRGATSASDHWYHAATGAPCYQVPMATNPALRRAPEIRDARKLALLPSVTTVLGIVNRPGIQFWRMQQFLLAVREFQAQGGLGPSAEGVAALGVSPEALDAAGTEAEERMDEIDGLDDAQWRAVQQLYSRRVSQAADLGSQVHDLLERHIRWRYQLGSAGTGTGTGTGAGSKPAWPDFVAPMRDAVDHWLDEAVDGVLHVERSFASRYGYGGKVDLVCRLRDGDVAVCDFKTQAARKRFALHSYWPSQLAAYAVGLGVPTARLVNVCLDTTTPGTYLVKDWTRGDADDAVSRDANAPYWEAFRLAYLLWCSPLGRQFEPLRDVPGSLPIPPWAGILANADQGVPVTILGPDDLVQTAA